MWPTEAFTTNAEPRYFLMVRALAGDSTTSNDLPVAFARRGRSALPFDLAFFTGVGAAAEAFLEAGFLVRFALMAGFAAGFFLAFAIDLSSHPPRWIRPPPSGGSRRISTAPARRAPAPPDRTPPDAAPAPRAGRSRRPRARWRRAPPGPGRHRRSAPRR